MKTIPFCNSKWAMSIIVNSYSLISSVESGELVDQDESRVHEPDLWDPVVLVLPAVLVYFLHHEINLQENDDDDVLMNESEIVHPNLNLVEENIQVGMELLPDTLDADPVFSSQQELNLCNGRPHSEGVRLWSRFFAPTGDCSGFLVPSFWSDFITLALMDPIRFNWAKSFLESSDGNMIIQDKEKEMCFTFCIPK
jgi:hypothetical protein